MAAGHTISNISYHTFLCSATPRRKRKLPQNAIFSPKAHKAAAAIAAQLHIGEVHANCLPEDKLSHIRADQSADAKVCMIGDGVNDAPALKAADVGIAMGGVDSDIAVDTADIALVDEKSRSCRTSSRSPSA